MPPTSPAVEDYLKAVYQHTEWQDQPITPKVLAGALGVAPSSVTEMVKKMAAAGLVSHVPYGAVRLTAEGEARALQVLRRHRVIETWLVREHAYTWDEVHDEAEVLEHALSDRLLDAIDAGLGRPSHDPHGDAIPTADGTVAREPFVLLADAAVGHEGRVIRVSDRDPALLRAIDESGLRVGDAVTVLSRVLDAVTLRRDDTEVTLPGAASETIWLSAAPTSSAAAS